MLKGNSPIGAHAKQKELNLEGPVTMSPSGLYSQCSESQLFDSQWTIPCHVTFSRSLCLPDVSKVTVASRAFVLAIYQVKARKLNISKHLNAIYHTTQILWGHCPHGPNPLRLLSTCSRSSEIIAPWPRFSEVTCCSHSSDPLRSLPTQLRSSEVTIHTAQILWDHCAWPRTSEVTAHGPGPLRSLPMAQILCGHRPHGPVPLSPLPVAFWISLRPH